MLNFLVTEHKKLRNDTYEFNQTAKLFNGEYLYSHLIVTYDCFNSSEKEELEKQFKPDFTSVLMNDDFKFIHVFDPDNIDFIETKGLRVSSEDSDLGVGLYLIKADDIEALEHLKDYVMDKEVDEIGIITGYFSGDYIQCMTSGSHKNYVVVFEDIALSNIENIEIMSVDDFFYY